MKNTSRAAEIAEIRAMFEKDAKTASAFMNSKWGDRLAFACCVLVSVLLVVSYMMTKPR